MLVRIQRCGIVLDVRIDHRSDFFNPFCEEFVVQIAVYYKLKIAVISLQVLLPGEQSVDYRERGHVDGRCVYVEAAAASSVAAESPESPEGHVEIPW